MKKGRVFLCTLLLACLILDSCNQVQSSYPSTPEDVVKAAVACLHNNDWTGYSHYVDPEYKIKTVMFLLQKVESQENDLIDQVVISNVEIDKENRYKDGSAWVSGVFTKRNGYTEKLEWPLIKINGKWYVTYFGNFRTPY